MKPLTSAVRAHPTEAFSGGPNRLFHLCSAWFSSHAQTEACVPAQALLEMQKENPDIPTIQELYELTVSPMLLEIAVHDPWE